METTTTRRLQNPLHSVKKPAVDLSPTAAQIKCPIHQDAKPGNFPYADHALNPEPKEANGRFGGAGRDRTDDLLLAKQALSQLSYGPVTRRRMLLNALN